MPEEIASENQPKPSNLINGIKFFQRAFRPKDSLLNHPREVNAANVANDVVRDRIQFRQQDKLLKQEEQMKETQRKLEDTRAQLELAESESMTDALTGLHNLRWHNSELKKSIAEAQRDGRSLILGNIDFDEFKFYNEVFGHHTGGDPALQSVANLPFRQETPISRVGGDEFGQILKGITPQELTVICARYLERIVDMGHLLFDKAPRNEENFQKYVEKNGSAPENMTLSMGWALYEGETLEEFKNKANQAEHEAKRLGKACGVLAINGGDGLEFIRLTNPVGQQQQALQAA